MTEQQLMKDGWRTTQHCGMAEEAQ